jgi:hypothetical protein
MIKLKCLFLAAPIVDIVLNIRKPEIDLLVLNMEVIFLLYFHRKLPYYIASLHELYLLFNSSIILFMQKHI